MTKITLPLIILLIITSIIFSQETFIYSLSIGETTLVTKNELGFGMPEETTSEFLIPVSFSKSDVGYSLIFGDCTESLILDGSPVPPIISANRILKDKTITVNIIKDDYTIEIPNLTEIAKEFNPVDPNLLMAILFPPMDDILTNGTAEILIDFPRVSEEKQSMNETFAVVYTYIGESEFAGYLCDVVNFEFDGDETSKISGPLGDTISTGFGSGSGMLMYSQEMGLTIWGDLEYQIDRVKNITLNNKTYINEEKTGYGMSISPADEE